MKLSIAVDVDKQFILTHKIRKSRAHDTKDFVYLVKKIKCKNVLADKGYSSKKNRHFVVNKLKAIPIIPKKKNEGQYYLKSGRILPFDEERYPKRGIVENVFFCIKQKCLSRWKIYFWFCLP